MGDSLSLLLVVGSVYRAAMASVRLREVCLLELIK
jgi:hypothetical protein